MTLEERSDLEHKLATVEQLLITYEAQTPSRETVIAVLEAMRDETKRKLA